jgi:hypothetical protein
MLFISATSLAGGNEPVESFSKAKKRAKRIEWEQV